MLPSGHKFHTSSEHWQNFNRPKIENNPSQYSASAVNMTLPAFATERRAAAPGCGAAAAWCPALSIGIFCAYGSQQQTRHPPLLRSTDGTD